MKMNTASQIAEAFEDYLGHGNDAQEALQSAIEEFLGAQTDEYKAHVYAYVIDNYDRSRLSAVITEGMMYER
ncbi:hypothetical protein [Caulobacter phage BL198]|uniref:Uncharacterized protein n=1 Tax=Caulobacter phage BL198 TaxID=3020395 RepID=A0AAE9WYA4_9CAUD|nr:hypothetical protein [Caulobacter phage BL198]